MTSKAEYEDMAVSELAKWPGTGVEFGRAGKHLVAMVSFDGRTRKVFYPGSPSDSGHGVQNFAGDLRKTLRELGARRLTKPPSEPPKPSGKPSRPRRCAKLPKPPQKPMLQSLEDKWLTPLKALRQAMEKVE